VRGLVQALDLPHSPCNASFTFAFLARKMNYWLFSFSTAATERIPTSMCVLVEALQLLPRDALRRA
jgi:hypothetical protein